MIGAPTGPNGILLLSAGGLSPQELNSPMSCEAFANDSTTRVAGIAGVLFPIDAALDIMFGDGCGIIGDRPRLIVDSSPDIEILAVIFRE